MKRLLPVVILAALLTAPAAAGPRFPDLIRLPDGWQPEGIASGKGTTFYVGSIPTGDIFVGDYRTGERRRVLDAPEGRAAIGLKLARGKLFVAGGPTGDAYVYRARTGEALAAYDFASEDTFVNDVAIARRQAYFTDSRRPVLYRVPVKGGSATEIPIDVPYEEGFNLNGIAATGSGRHLLAVQSNTGVLWRIDPGSGAAQAVDLGGTSLTMGDGLLLRGKTLWVVRNRANQVVQLRLRDRFTAGEVVRTLTDPDFDVPTTLARKGGRLYAVNARFGTAPEDDTRYDVVKVDR